MLVPYSEMIELATVEASSWPVVVSAVPGGAVSMMPAALSTDWPCRTKSKTIYPSSAQASADPMDIRAVERNPTATKRSRFLRDGRRNRCWRGLFITSPFAAERVGAQVKLPHTTAIFGKICGSG